MDITKNNEIIILKEFISKYEFAKTFWQWTKGLMFSKKKTLVFEFKKEMFVSIHMLFVFYPIYAIALDRNKRVTNFKKLDPFISFFNFKGKYLIEIPSQTYEKSELIIKIKKGKIIEF